MNSALRLAAVAAMLVAATVGRADSLLPPPRAMVADYRFGWQSIEAARATIRVRPVSRRTLAVEAAAATRGLARSLWQMDATFQSDLDPSDMFPRRIELKELYREKQITTRLAFGPAEVVRERKVTVDGRSKGRPREFRVPGARDLSGALLWVRAQPLRPGETHALILFPGADPYLARASVAGRETLRINGVRRDAIRVDLELRGLRPNGTTVPVKKFRRARAWLSDDADRVVLRAEADVFVGKVFAELDGIEFPK
jgi:hypothetical protein